MSRQSLPRVLVRLPAEVKGWVEEQAHRNLSSISSEIVRAVRERMDQSVHGNKLGEGARDDGR